MIQKKQRSEQDIRIIQLSKWQIPKSKSVMNYIGKDTYLSIGYFDMIDIQKVEDPETHPLVAAYNMSRRHPKRENYSDQGDITTFSLLEDYTMQELFVFADVNEHGLDRKKIDSFWKTDSLIMLVSLIHVDNESQISDIMAKIHGCFKGENYLLYFSFDYSGIVLLTKDMAINDYLQRMFKLNYDNKNGKKLIRDSYSFYGFLKKGLKEYFDKFECLQNYRHAFDKDIISGRDEKFAISVNVGIQNFNNYKKFMEEIRNVSPNIKEYGLLGRHDISIVNEEADLKWLIYVQYLLDKFTVREEGGSDERLFFTHETFVKISYTGGFEDTETSEPNWTYNKAKEKLDNLYNDFFEKLREKPYNGEYAIPVHAVKLSILSILRNRFAEDFVLCMYQSFCEFIEYLTEKMSHEDNDITEFDNCFNSYFRGLNSLVNSAMHSERQFIQATAFNAIIYDVPSKIMAFYMAIIDKLQQMMRTDIDSRYTFLLTPSFSNEISVRIISYNREILPHNRILMVLINERSLYNPKAVIRRMAHEVAHYVGDNLRNRETRKKHIKLSVIYIVLSHVMHGSFLISDDLFQLISDVEKEISHDKRFFDGENNYSNILRNEILDMVEMFYKNQNIKAILHGYIAALLKKYLGEGSIEDIYLKEERKNLQKYLASVAAWNVGVATEIWEESYYTKIFSDTDIQILKNLICNDIEQELKVISCDRERLMRDGWITQSIIARTGTGILNDITIKRYVKGLTDVYSEAFADIQMVLLTDISYKDYLEGFVKEENLDLSRLSNSIEDTSRISMVVLALQFTGMWMPMKEAELFLDNSQKNYEEVRKLHKKIATEIEILKRNITDDGMRQLKEYYGVSNNITESPIELKEDADSIWSIDETMQVPQDNISFYINENLLIYLVECIGKSVEQYKILKNFDNIKRLRKTIREVSDFEKIETAFLTICEEIRYYKEKIFAN